MDAPFFTTATGITVIAAASSFLAGVTGAVISSLTIQRTHKQRLDADEKLAKRRATDEFALTKQKFDYDRAQAVFRRRFEIAEQVLADAYRFRSMMAFVRSGFSMNGEGEGRPAESFEPEAVKRMRNTYFVTLKRLEDSNEFIAAMFARRTASQAHFGPDAERAFELFQRALHQTRTAAALLIEWTTENESVNRDTMQKLRQDIWQPVAQHAGRDEIGADTDEGVAVLERLCRPVLEWTA